MADYCGWLIAVDDCDPHRRRLRLALPLSKLGAGRTCISNLSPPFFSTSSIPRKIDAQVLIHALFWFRYSFGLVSIHSLIATPYGYDGFDRSRLVLVLFTIDRPCPPPRCPFFSLGPTAVPTPSH